jgi:hypothetical protein
MITNNQQPVKGEGGIRIFFYLAGYVVVAVAQVIQSAFQGSLNHTKNSGSIGARA